jgi:hypothetical protein
MNNLKSRVARRGFPAKFQFVGSFLDPWDTGMNQINKKAPDAMASGAFYFSITGRCR